MAPERSAVEDVKEASRFLRGALVEELANEADCFSSDSTAILKFHGIYQQDDRDVRRERKAKGLGPDHICMVRAGIPGGVLSAEQYLVMDRLADEVGNGTLRVTTRQGIQYHFTRKSGLRPLVRTLNQHLVTTLAACGDVVRNVMCCPAPLADRSTDEVQAHARRLSARLKPKSSAYYEVWIDGEQAVTASAPPDPVAGTATGAPSALHGTEEPLYGPTYLPRKFKIGFAYPGDNCIDVYTQDIGIVPVLDGARLEGFTILVGGGLGKSHSDDSTHPRLADPLCTVGPDELVDVVEAIVGIQRDHGNRVERKHARMKYLVETWGVDGFRAELESRLGRVLVAPLPVAWRAADDHLGWSPQPDGAWFLGVPVENGRILDRDDRLLRRGLRAAIERFHLGVRLTPNQDVLLTGVAGSDRAGLEALLRDHGVALADDLAPVLRHSMACPALPTCGLALTDAERALPGVLSVLQDELASLGLGDEALHVRMTGCPNGCARPYTAEIGLVGRGKRSYDIHVGGDQVGTRLAEVLIEDVPGDQLVSVLRPVLAQYRAERRAGEGVGDYCHRVGTDALRAVAQATASTNGGRRRERRAAALASATS